MNHFADFATQAAHSSLFTRLTSNAKAGFASGERERWGELIRDNGIKLD